MSEPARPGPGTRRKVIFHVVLVVGVIAVVETLCGLYRNWYVDGIGGYGFPRDLFVPDDELAFGLRPDFVGRFTREYSDVEIRINSHGFRDAPFEERGDRPRVALVGDSVVFGAGVRASECMDARLEEALAGERRVSVLNLGVYAYSLDQYVALLHRQLPALRPDLVLVGFCANDIESGTEAPWPATVARGGVANILKRISNTAWLLAQIRRRVLRTDSRAHFRNTEDDWRGYCEEVVSRWSRPEDLARLRRNLDRLAGLASGPAAPPVAAVLWPTSYELEEPGGDWDAPRVTLRRALEERGIPFLDLHDGFGAAGPASELFLRGDRMHFSPAGHRLAASLLAPEIAARLPPPRR